MGVIKTIEEWQVEVGENVGGYIPDVLKESAGFLCDIREKYPNSFFDRSFGRGLANSICGTVGRPPAPLPEVPFSGGQCPVPYNVFVIFGTPGEPGAVELGVFVQRGAVTSIVGDFETLSGSGDSTRHLAKITVEAKASNGTPRTYYNEAIRTSAPLQPVGGYRLEPLGGVDNCGDPPSSLPPDPERDPNDFSTTVTICDKDDEGNDINCEDVEVVLPEKDLYNFPVCVEVDGKKICLDADGWSIEDASEEEEEKEEQEEEEEEEEKEVLAGLLVKVVEYPTRGRTYFYPDDPETVNAYMGHLMWKAKVGEKLVRTSPIEVRLPETYFPVPDDETNQYDLYSLNGAVLSVTEIKKIVKVPKT